MWPGGVKKCKLKEFDVVGLHDIECPHWDQASLNNIKLKLKLKLSVKEER